MTTAMKPQPGPTRDYHFPAFTRRELSNGVRLIIAPVRKLPLATVTVVANAGAMCDPIERDGIAALTANLLIEGTLEDGIPVPERFERLGASIDAGADWDAALVQMTVLATQLPGAFRLLGEVVTVPSFPDRELERLKAERLAELLQRRTEPRGLANDMFEKFVYEPASRYARPEAGSEPSVAAITRDDVGAFYADRYRPGGMTLLVVGDVDVERAEAMAYEAFGGLAGGTPALAATLDGPARPARSVHLVEKEDAPQSELRIGHVGLPRAHPDYFRVAIMNALLGGLFSSRINLNLREAHGYTYGASSSFDWRQGAGPFVVSTAVKSDVTVDAARQVLLEIDRMRAEEVEDEELSLATSFLDGVFPIRFETTDAIASALAKLVIYGLPEDYYDTYRERIRSVTAGDVLAAARQHLHPERLQTVIVGDPGVVLEPLEDAGFGDVLVYDAEGRRLAGSSA